MASPNSQGRRRALRLSLSTFFLVLALFFCAAHFRSSHPLLKHSTKFGLIIRSSDNSNEGCYALHGLKSYQAKCGYLMSKPQCESQGFINYLNLFYCICGRWPVLGYAVLSLWLLLLFYLLGNTAATYFCSNLVGLSSLLKLSPAIAGVTLLSLGNGAPDAFSSVVSFMGSPSTSLVGLNSVLGGAFFVSSVVVGIISICSSEQNIRIDQFCFLRDVCFLLLALLVLLAILFIGELKLWGAVAFSALYLVYVLIVSLTHLCVPKEKYDTSHFEPDPVLPIKGELAAPLLSSFQENEEVKSNKLIDCILNILELPLYLPRRLTIPDIDKDRWSKPFAVSSVTLSPILLALIWGSKMETLGSTESLIIISMCTLVGILMGIAVIMKTEKDQPPATSTSRFFWFTGGFLMSVTWTYIIAQELVSLLVSVGVILNISPSILGLTVLAWGNSLGDLIANMAVARRGGSSGAQVAVSGCYGGPIFNTLVGLGVSFVASSWRSGGSMSIPNDPTLYQIILFLFAGLLYALVMLPKRQMRPGKSLGCGLILIYLLFLGVRVGQSLGLIPLK